MNGLAVVWNTVQEHDGTVTVSSTAQGSMFKLFFPALDGGREKAIVQKPVEQENLNGNGECIMVVDDEAHLLDIAERMLSHLGYEVVCMGSGEEAVFYLQTRSVDLVILDMVMDPGISGRQTYERILTLHPGQKAILASGFSENDEVKAVLHAGAGAFIKKPYTMKKLGQTVQQVLTNSG